MNPTISLGGKTYEIPLLAIKQNRHIEPLVAKHSDYFLSVSKNGDRVKLLELTDEQACDFTKIVYYAVTRTQTALTFEQFEELPISMKDIMQALPVCLQQSGLFQKSGETSPPGEEQPSIGTASPQNSATS